MTAEATLSTAKCFDKIIYIEVNPTINKGVFCLAKIGNQMFFIITTSIRNLRKID